MPERLHPESIARQNTEQDMIRADGLTRTYGEFVAVDNVSFHVEKREVIGLLGHNGAGKTTIMKTLTGYLEPSAGSVTIEGLDIIQQRREAQRQIGYLPENCPVYPEMTVIDYLDYHAGLHGMSDGQRPSAIREAIARTRLEPKAQQPIGTLSRGYQQRVGVAQAILHRPGILILDEPTNGLDPSQIRHMRDLIRELSAQATVILSTHILQEVQAVCDRVLIIRNGKLALDSRLEDLKSSQRLLVAIDGVPEQAKSVLADVPAVRAVEHLQAVNGRHQYALSLDGTDSLAAAPDVARAALAGGYALYGLEPEVRDLEAVFGEIEAGKEVVHG